MYDPYIGIKNLRDKAPVFNAAVKDMMEVFAQPRLGKHHIDARDIKEDLEIFSNTLNHLQGGERAVVEAALIAVDPYLPETEDSTERRVASEILHAYSDGAWRMLMRFEQLYEKMANFQKFYYPEKVTA